MQIEKHRGQDVLPVGHRIENPLPKAKERAGRHWNHIQSCIARHCAREMKDRSSRRLDLGDLRKPQRSIHRRPNGDEFINPHSQSMVLIRIQSLWKIGNPALGIIDRDARYRI